jgi:hypothetical protein
MGDQTSVADMKSLLAEIGIPDVPSEHFAQWEPAQKSLNVALARLPRDLSWSDEPTQRLTERAQSSGR